MLMVCAGVSYNVLGGELLKADDKQLGRQKFVTTNEQSQKGFSRGEIDSYDELPKKFN